MGRLNYMRLAQNANCQETTGGPIEVKMLNMGKLRSRPVWVAQVIQSKPGQLTSPWYVRADDLVTRDGRPIDPLTMVDLSKPPSP